MKWTIHIYKNYLNLTFLLAFFNTILIEVIKMPRVKYTDSDIDLMARMMRAEAEGEAN